MSFQHRKQWSDVFMPEVKRILGEILITNSTRRQDTEENTDLVTLDLSPVRIACRVRNMSYYSRFAREFTLRAEIYNGTQTEVQKMVNGFGDYLFYGFGDSAKPADIKYFVGDLSILRKCYHKLERQTMQNDDRLSAFVVIPIDQPALADFVIHSNYLHLAAA